MQKKRREKPVGLQRGIYLLPNLFTTANLFLGFWSIVKSVNFLLGREDSLFESGVFLFGAAAADMLDGRLARLTNTASKFGLEYDSLADIISFGLAPSMMCFAWGLHDDGRLGFIGMFLFVACAAMRLARFNVQASNLESSDFLGLPTPIAGLTLASTILFFEPSERIVLFEMESLVLWLVYGLSFLMVSEVPYRSFKTLSLTSKQPFYYLLPFVGICMLIAIEPVFTFWLATFSYVLSGLIEFPLRKIFGKKTSKSKNKNSESSEKIHSLRTQNSEPKNR